MRKLTRAFRQTSDVVIDDFLDPLLSPDSSAGRPPPGLRTRVGRPAMPAASRRPRRIVLTFIPVICASRFAAMPDAFGFQRCTSAALFGPTQKDIVCMGLGD